jgi:MoCo/4Fe-4S cofactor protein with predicted Tat translocation signal
MPQVAPRQWRSLQQLEADPAFQDHIAQEFPNLRKTLKARPGRRQALQLMTAVLTMAGLGGCGSGAPGGVLIPAVRIPSNIVPGVPNRYATAHLNSGYALGTVVTHQMGRPIKVEGNPNHPSSLGAMDPFAQAEVLSFYDPDRAMAIMCGNVPSDRQSLLAAVAAARSTAVANKGKGLRFLTGTVTSPTLAQQLDRALGIYPGAQWHQWEPINRDNVLRGAQVAYGRPVDLILHPDKADVILGIDSDLIEATPGWVRYARDLASRRNPTRTQSPSRIYAVEPAPSLLGSTADHRFVGSGRELHRIVVALAASILGTGAAPSDVPPWMTPVIADLKAHQGRALIHVGPAQPPDVHALVHAMNEMLGARGATLDVVEPVVHDPKPEGASLAELVRDMHAGDVDTLVILDSNPTFTAPGALGFAEAMQRVASFVLAPETNETAQSAHWAVPLAHAWESWTDARGHDGTATILQPQAMPLYDGMAPAELVALFIEPFPPSSMAMVEETWQGQFQHDFATTWRNALASGIVPNTTSTRASVTLRPGAAQDATPSIQGLSILFRPDPSLWDRRYANNGWLQELPRPLNKLTWDNPLLIPPVLADKLRLSNGDMVRLSVGTRQTTVPVWMQPGQASDTLVAWIGNGRRVVGKIGEGAGFDYYPLTGSTGPVSLERVRGHYDLASTEHHKPPVWCDGWHSATRQSDRIPPGFASCRAKALPGTLLPPADRSGRLGHECRSQCVHWLQRLRVIACQAENNIPVVGKEQVEMEREMQWLRIDRYYDGTPVSPETFFQPMLCMHCEKAPCELVCPVGATVHDSEGLNLMIYPETS